MKLIPMLQVPDVAASSRWYQEALGLTSGHGGDEYEMLFSGDDFVLQLHKLDAHEHGFLTEVTPGACGASLWFGCDDHAEFDATFARAVAVGSSVLAGPAWNPLAHHYEATVADHDGYFVAIHSPFDPEGPDSADQVPRPV